MPAQLAHFIAQLAHFISEKTTYIHPVLARKKAAQGKSPCAAQL